MIKVYLLEVNSMKQIVIFIIALLIASCAPTLSEMPTQSSTNIVISTVTSTQAMPTATQTFTPTPPPSPSGKLIFTYFRGLDAGSLYWRSGYNSLFPNLTGGANIFISNWDGSELEAITTNGLDGFSYVQDISPNGKKILVASFSGYDTKFGNLYVINIDEKKAQKVIGYVTHPAGNVDFSGIAKWINNSRIAYTGFYGGKNGIFSINEDGTELLTITAEASPYKIFAIDPQSGIYWRAMSGFSWEPHLRWASIDGTQQKIVGQDILKGSISMSPDGEFITWGSNAPKLTSKIYEITNPIDVTPPNWEQQGGFNPFVSPDGSLIFLAQYIFWNPEEYKNPDSQFSAYIHYLENNLLMEISFPNEGVHEIVEEIIWSPDVKFALLRNVMLDLKGHSTSSPLRIIDLQNLNFITSTSDNLEGRKSNFIWFHPSE
jgi:hypothetical protein